MKHTAEEEKAAGVIYNAKLLSRTFNTDDRPGASTVLFLPTFPDSTQTIRLYSSFPKSGIGCALADHGFHTTVDKELSFSMRILRPSFGSTISTGAAVPR